MEFSKTFDFVLQILTSKIISDWFGQEHVAQELAKSIYSTDNRDLRKYLMAYAQTGIRALLR